MTTDWKNIDIEKNKGLLYLIILLFIFLFFLGALVLYWIINAIHIPQILIIITAIVVGTIIALIFVYVVFYEILYFIKNKKPQEVEPVMINLPIVPYPPIEPPSQDQVAKSPHDQSGRELREEEV